MDEPVERGISNLMRLLTKDHLTVAPNDDGNWSANCAEIAISPPPSLANFMRSQDEGQNKHYNKLRDQEFSRNRWIRSNFYTEVRFAKLVDPCFFASFIDVLTRKIPFETDPILRRKLIHITAEKLKFFADENTEKSIVIPASAYEALQVTLDTEKSGAIPDSDYQSVQEILDIEKRRAVSAAAYQSLQVILDTEKSRATPDLKKFPAAITIALRFVDLDKTFNSPSKEESCGAIFDHIVDATSRRINEHIEENVRFSIPTVRTLTNTIVLLCNEADAHPKLVTQQYVRLLKRVEGLQEVFGDDFFKGHNIVETAKYGLSAIPLRNKNGVVIAAPLKPTPPQPTAQKDRPKHTPT